MELRYVKGDLFKVAPSEAYLLHACNCQGEWGSGIAKAFKAYYPFHYIAYHNHCKNKDPENDILGTSIIIKDKVVCLFTSSFWGRRCDGVSDILTATEKSLKMLAKQLPDNALIYSPKINSGLFKTPWELTEKLVNEFLAERPDVTWVVVDYVP